MHIGVNVRLSHSQISMYSACGKKYDYHYNHKLREMSKSAALFCGSAIDLSINQALIDLRNSSLESLKYYQDVFDKHWTVAEINKKIVPLKTSNLVAYAASDLDKSLIIDQDATALGFTSAEKMMNFVSFIQRDKPRLENLAERELTVLQTCNWLSMQRKGHLMIEEYWNNILPKITKVYEVQKEVSLTNEDGHSIIGFVDAVLDFGDGPVICDLKTSSRKYAQDSASKSPQLAIYKHALQEVYPNASTAFLVLYKKIEQIGERVCTKCSVVSENNRVKTCSEEYDGNRCGGEFVESYSHKATSDIIFGNISQELETNVVENYDVILKGIQAGIFYRNWDNCEQGYGNCPYLMLCRKNVADKLIKVE